MLFFVRLAKLAEPTRPDSLGLVSSLKFLQAWKASAGLCSRLIMTSLITFLGLLSLTPTISHAAETQVAPKAVKIFLPENRDAVGRIIPINPQLLNLLRVLGHQADLKFEFIILPWRRAQIEALAGHGLVYGFSKSTLRMSQYRYSETIIEERVWAVSDGARHFKVTGLEDLRGKYLAVGVGYSYGLDYEKAREANIFELVEDSGSISGRLRILVSGGADLMLWPSRGFTQAKQVEHYINQTSMRDFEDPVLRRHHFVVSTAPIFFDTVHIVAAKTHFDEALDKIDRALDVLKKNGRLAQALQDYH